MNSFNHYSLGSVAQWLYEDVAGIRTDADRPGYEHVMIRPTPGDLDHATATFRSVRGPIHTAWRRTDDAFELRVDVPANVTATVVLPAGEGVTEGGRDAGTALGVHALRREDGAWIAEIGSGVYDFVVTAVEHDATRRLADVRGGERG